MKKHTMLTLALSLIIIPLMAQKKVLSFEDYDLWKKVENKYISDDGRWISYETTVERGDGVLHLTRSDLSQKHEFIRGDGAKFSPTTSYVVFKIKPEYDTLRTKKLNKEKDLPKDSLAVLVFGEDSLQKFEKLKLFKLAEEESDWMYFLSELELKDTVNQQEEGDTTATEKPKPKKTFDKKAPKTATLHIYKPTENKMYQFENVNTADISRNGAGIAFSTLQNDTLLWSKVFYFDTKKEKEYEIFNGQGITAKLQLDNAGKQLAIIHTNDTTEIKNYELRYWKTGNTETQVLVDTTTAALPEKWTVNDRSNLHFSRNDERLFFETKIRELPEPKDTLLKEEKVELDLWSWQDSILQPQQLAQLNREKNKAYMAVYQIKDKIIVQLEDEDLPNVRTFLKGNGDIALAANSQPYLTETSWSLNRKYDLYRINVKTGQRQLFKKAIQGRIDFSSAGNFVLWFNSDDLAWYSVETATGKTTNLTGNLNVNFYDKDHDYPSAPGSYGILDWTENDQEVLVYDRYDIWQLDPTGKKQAENLTKGYGRENSIRLRHQITDREANFINLKETALLKVFNEETKDAGFAVFNPKKKELGRIVSDGFDYYSLLKAKNAKQIIVQKGNVKDYPDIWASDMTLENWLKISDANPQQVDYNWTTVELVKWITSEGTIEEGLLYKPENLDPNKKYPMMVYFYRLQSDEIHQHIAPGPSRSIINPTFYASNGYLVFIPNIRYKDGYPGMSAYNYVMSGTVAMLNTRNYIDKDKLALQGQSWGGYQIAYIVTQTDMFKAASPGAPVSNMTSAYGGIRWQSGMSRMFQYEQSQSRIGGTLWEKPLQYIENSPIFYVPKINTPLLIRHNDGDGAVPWYQGIELFVAMRRLGKPAWLLNYNGAPHNEKGDSPNRYDLSIRMKQFFDHYLLGTEAPDWMKYGIPALEKGKKLGY